MEKVFCKDCKFYISKTERFKARCGKIIEPELTNEFNGTVFQKAIEADLVNNSNGDCQYFEQNDNKKDE